MNALKPFIGGLIGSIVGSAGAIAFESILDQKLLWLVTLAGIGAGVGIRLVAAKPNRGLVTGLVGAACTLLGLGLANLGYSQVAKKPMGANPIAQTRLSETQEELEAAKAEAERLEAERLEAERLEAERLQAEKDAASAEAEGGQGASNVPDDETAQASETDQPIPDMDLGAAAGPVATAKRTSTDWSWPEVAAHSVSMLAAFLLGGIGGPRREDVVEPAAEQADGSPADGVV